MFCAASGWSTLHRDVHFVQMTGASLFTCVLTDFLLAGAVQFQRRHAKVFSYNSRVAVSPYSSVLMLFLDVPTFSYAYLVLGVCIVSVLGRLFIALL